MQGASEGPGGVRVRGTVSPAFFVLLDQCFQEEAMALFQCAGYLCVYTHMPSDVLDLVSNTSSPDMAFSLWPASTWTKDPQLTHPT